MANATTKNGFNDSETQQDATTYDYLTIRTTPSANWPSLSNNSEAIVILRSVAIVVGLVGASFNGIVLMVLFSRRSRSQQKFTLLFVNQIVLDFSSCVALSVTYAVNIPVFVFYDDAWWRFFCVIFHTELPIYYFQQGSVCNLVQIAIERNIFIVHQVTYKKYFRRWMAYAGAILSWVLPIIYDSVIFMNTKIVDGQCRIGYAWPSSNSPIIFTYCMFLSLIVIPLLTLIVCYGGILLFVKQHRKVMHANQTRNQPAAAAAAGSNPVQQKASRQETELVATMVLISTMYFVSWTPNQIWFFVRFYQILDSKALYLTSYLFVYLSACLNPFIYVSKQERIRRGVLDIVRKVIRPKSDVQGTRSTNETIQTISFTA